MIEKKKTLVILSFDQTKTPKKKFKKLQKEILSYLSDQNFKDFFILKEKKYTSFFSFREKHKKTFYQAEDIFKENYENFLYLECENEFFCGDYNYFCQNSKNQINIALSYQLEKALCRNDLEKLPLRLEKIMFFSKSALSSFEVQQKNPQLIFGGRVFLDGNKPWQTIKCLKEFRAPCLFLDRDGIIIKDKKYLSKPEDIEFVDGIFDLVRWAKNQKWYVIVVTNQSGIGRGLYSEEDYQICQDFIDAKFKEQNLSLTKSYFSPYHEDSKDEKIRSEMFTRKPFPGMLLKASKDFPIDFEQSIMVGDKKSDDFIETPLTTYFLQGDYPLKEGDNIFTTLNDLLNHLKSNKHFEKTEFLTPIQDNFTSSPVV